MRYLDKDRLNVDDACTGSDCDRYLSQYTPEEDHVRIG